MQQAARQTCIVEFRRSSAPWIQGGNNAIEQIACSLSQKSLFSALSDGGYQDLSANTAADAGLSGNNIQQHPGPSHSYGSYQGSRYTSGQHGHRPASPGCSSAAAKLRSREPHHYQQQVYMHSSEASAAEMQYATRFPARQAATNAAIRPQLQQAPWQTALPARPGLQDSTLQMPLHESLKQQLQEGHDVQQSQLQQDLKQSYQQKQAPAAASSSSITVVSSGSSSIASDASGRIASASDMLSEQAAQPQPQHQQQQEVAALLQQLDAGMMAPSSAFQLKPNQVGPAVPRHRDVVELQGGFRMVMPQPPSTHMQENLTFHNERDHRGLLQETVSAIKQAAAQQAQKSAAVSAKAATSHTTALQAADRQLQQRYQQHSKRQRNHHHQQQQPEQQKAQQVQLQEQEQPRLRQQAARRQQHKHSAKQLQVDLLVALQQQQKQHQPKHSTPHAMTPVVAATAASTVSAAAGPKGLQAVLQVLDTLEHRPEGDSSDAGHEVAAAAVAINGTACSISLPAAASASAAAKASDGSKSVMNILESSSSQQHTAKPAVDLLGELQQTAAAAAPPDSQTGSSSNAAAAEEAALVLQEMLASLAPNTAEGSATSIISTAESTSTEAMPQHQQQQLSLEQLLKQYQQQHQEAVTLDAADPAASLSMSVQSLQSLLTAMHGSSQTAVQEPASTAAAGIDLADSVAAPGAGSPSLQQEQQHILQLQQRQQASEQQQQLSLEQLLKRYQRQHQEAVTLDAADPAASSSTSVQSLQSLLTAMRGSSQTAVQEPASTAAAGIDLADSVVAPGAGSPSLQQDQQHILQLQQRQQASEQQQQHAEPQQLAESHQQAELQGVQQHVEVQQQQQERHLQQQHQPRLQKSQQLAQQKPPLQQLMQELQKQHAAEWSASGQSLPAAGTEVQNVKDILSSLQPTNSSMAISLPSLDMVVADSAASSNASAAVKPNSADSTAGTAIPAATSGRPADSSRTTKQLVAGMDLQALFANQPQHQQQDRVAAAAPVGQNAAKPADKHHEQVVPGLESLLKDVCASSSSSVNGRRITDLLNGDWQSRFNQQQQRQQQGLAATAAEAGKRQSPTAGWGPQSTSTMQRNQSSGSEVASAWEAAVRAVTGEPRAPDVAAAATMPSASPAAAVVDVEQKNQMEDQTAARIKRLMAAIRGNSNSSSVSSKGSAAKQQHTDESQTHWGGLGSLDAAKRRRAKEREKAAAAAAAAAAKEQRRAAKKTAAAAAGTAATSRWASKLQQLQQQQQPATVSIPTTAAAGACDLDSSESDLSDAEETEYELFDSSSSLSSNSSADGVASGHSGWNRQLQEVQMPALCSVRQLALLLGANVRELESMLNEQLGEELQSAEDIVSPESAELAALEYGKILLRPPEDAAAAASAVPRPPVVTVMGHVDHGKTSLLDALRSSNVAAGEAGGITQHIGAFEVTMPGSGARLTFLDTPGHAAFGAMRARGAAATDIVVLAVAADDGVMPQTREALAHARAAQVPVVVALTKCDLPQARSEEVKLQLVSEGLELEEYGGDVQCVVTAAKSRQGLQELEEALLLQAEVMELKASPEVPAAGVVVEAQVSKGLGAVATIILRKGTLKVGDPIVVGTEYGRVRAIKDGHGQAITTAGPGQAVVVSGLKGLPGAGDELLVVGSEGRASKMAAARTSRAQDFRLGQLARMQAEHSRRQQQMREKEYERKRELKRRIQEIRMSGFKRHSATDLGQLRTQSLDLEEQQLKAQAAAAAGGTLAAAAALSEVTGAGGADSAAASCAAAEASDGSQQSAVEDAAPGVPALSCDAPTVTLLIKADVQGSAEAVRDAVIAAGASKAHMKVVYCGVGPISPSDVHLAAATGAKVIAFNLRPPAPDVYNELRRVSIEVLQHRVIYHLVDEVDAAIDAAVSGAAEQLGTSEEVMGSATVLQVFPLINNRKEVGKVAGCRVQEGLLQQSPGVIYRVLRDGKVVFEGPCTSLRQHKNDVQAVKKASDCGVVLDEGRFEDMLPGDVVQCIQRRSTRR